MIERQKATALTYINQYQLLKQVRDLEQEALDHIIDDALSMDSEIGHWHAYERLKKQAKHIVGWYAKRDELMSSAHYEMMIMFLDWLLTEKRRAIKKQEDLKMIEGDSFDDEW